MTDASAADALQGRDVALAITRGAARLCADLGYVVLTEFELPDGRRADVMALGRAGDLLIVEVKSGLADFRSDSKWTEYRNYCDRLCFAVDERFPRDVLPDDAGLIIADGFGGALVRAAPEHRLAAARRKALTLRFARAAAARLERAATAEET